MGVCVENEGGCGDVVPWKNGRARALSSEA